MNQIHQGQTKLNALNVDLNGEIMNAKGQGRKPKPTKLKILEDYRNKKRINPDEPKPKVKIPSCPKHLTGIARKEWRRIAKELKSLGILSNIDRSALAAYCVVYGRWVQAEKLVAKSEGGLVKTKKGNIVQHPSLAIANKALELMHRYLTEFGMTPSSRTRVSVKSKEPDSQEKTPINR